MNQIRNPSNDPVNADYLSPDHQELWSNLREFDFDEPGAVNPFSQRLGKEQGWSPDYVARVVDEYRRFLFLTAASGHVVCPSEDVDRAWHEHLMHTRSYWHRLCRDLLKRDLHHEPSRGGSGELRKHWEMYRNTLHSYRRIFGSAPPRDIWPPAYKRFDPKSEAAPINRLDCWIVRKPRFIWLKRLRRSGILAAVGLPVLAAGLGPLDLNGPSFLLLYVSLLAGSVAVILILHYLSMMGRIDDDEDLEPGEIACLTFGPDAVVCTEISGLVQNGTIEIGQKDAGGWSGRTESELLVSQTLPADASKFQKIIYNEIRRTKHSLRSLTTTLSPVTEKVQESLMRRGYLVGHTKANLACWASVLILVGMVIFGATKIVIGLERNKPVGFLVFLTVIPACSAFLAAFIKPYLTHSGKSFLETQKAAHQDLKAQVSNRNSPAEIIMICAALYGTNVLRGDHLDDLQQSWIVEGIKGNTVPKKRSTTGSGCSTSSGCTTSGCGGGGGGGCGGGGGGCGGCSGGN